MIDYSIEVAVSEGTTTTQRGNLLVDLMRDVFDATNHTSGQAIKVTGMEIDITATHNITSEKIYAECKAHRDPISADVLSKLLGNVYHKEVDQGWLITSSKLSKDAEGWKEAWEKKPPEQRRRLQIYNPSRLLELLISSNRVFSPTMIGSRNWYLLITNFGRYWASLESVAGVPNSVIVYDAKTGALVADADLLHRLKSTDTSLRDFEWPIPSSDNSVVTELPVDLTETVVDVATGDNWADYRPARPQDFVGRLDLQNSIRGLFLEIKNGRTKTRLFSISGPSGWGKSSLTAKVRDRCFNLANRRKFYMTAFDMRAAKSANYVAAAVLRCFSLAIQQGFILPPVLPLQVGPPMNPLESDSLKDCLQQLKAKNRVIILVFDQFEEVLTKRELSPLFDRLRLLSLSVDAQQENLVLGFAWKSDAFLPQDHPAYYLWHQLKDRRLDLNLPRFGPKDISEALKHFQTEMGQRLNPVLRSQLVQHCQGFPWLLKKLCIHVFNLIKSGLTQQQVLERGLEVRSLFDADMVGLSSKESLCIKEIARMAPVEWVHIVEQFGNDTYSSLLDKRLIIRSGDRLNPYWDIFKDYLRTGEIPYVPVSFLPKTEIRTLSRAATTCFANGQAGVSLETLSKSLSITSGSAMNVVRDLKMFGLAEKRGERVVTMLDLTAPKDILAMISKAVAAALNNHAFTIQIRKSLTKDSLITEQDLILAFDKAFPYASLRADIKRVYTLKLAKYLTAIRFIQRVRDGWFLTNEAPGQLIFMPRVRGSGIFLGDAPPEKVLELIRTLLKAPKSRQVLDRSGLRNAVVCAIMLGLVEVHNGIVFTQADISDAEPSLAEAVSSTDSFRIVRGIISNNPNLTGTEVGSLLSVKLRLVWSNATYLRRGNALRRWVTWYENLK